jgi:hypothetical protein
MAMTRAIRVSRNGPEVPLWKIATSQLTWLCSWQLLPNLSVEE